jgi:hypothetical protein
MKVCVELIFSPEPLHECGLGGYFSTILTSILCENCVWRRRTKFNVMCLTCRCVCQERVAILIS